MTSKFNRVLLALVISVTVAQNIVAQTEQIQLPVLSKQKFGKKESEPRNHPVINQRKLAPPRQKIESDTIANVKKNRFIKKVKEVSPPVQNETYNQPIESTSNQTFPESAIQSAIKESDFNIHRQATLVSAGFSRISIAGNMFIDVKKLNENTTPASWRFINYKAQLNFTKENLYYKNASTTTYNYSLGIGDYDGSAVIRMNLHATCECIANIDTKGNKVLIGVAPQTFRLINFRKILNGRATGEPCRSGSNITTKGGWDGKITFSANEKGDIRMNLLLENYSAEQVTYKGVKPSQISYRYTANNILMENEQTPLRGSQSIRIN